jgi:hypothetical protein
MTTIADQSHRAGEEWIGQPLMTNARTRTVPADEPNVVAERKQLVLDRLDQGRAIDVGGVITRALAATGLRNK